MSTTYLSEIRILIEKDQIPTAVSKLKQLLKNSPQLNDLLLQSARYNELVKLIISGLLSFEEISGRKSDIRKDLLSLIDEIELREKEPKIKQELSAAVAVLVTRDRRAQKYKQLNRFGIGFLLLAVLVAGFLYLLRDRIWPGSFLVTVLVHGGDGLDDRILKEEGEVWLDFGTGRFDAKIDAQGEATFKEIPSLYLDRTAKITIDHPQPYKVINADSSYLLNAEKAIYLAARLTKLDSVFGYVRDFVTEQPLEGVRVSSRNIETFTNTHGWFSLNFPPDARRKFVTLLFEKKGYRIDRIDNVAPHLGQEQIISLHPER